MSDVHLSAYVGRHEVAYDRADPERLAGLAATLDHQSPPWAEGVLPPLGHWLCFPPRARASEIGDDGHPVRTDEGLLPNIGLPRRMWAGGRLTFRREIPLGAELVRTSTLTHAQPKAGRSGSMVLITLRHDIGVPGEEAAIVEEQDLVYRPAATPGSPAVRASEDPGSPDSCVRTLVPDPVLLFRYSALTFNSHRIHYDADYARDTEGYPGLVVQGPLIATLLMDHLLRERPGRRVEEFAFRAVSPLFCGESLSLGLTDAEDRIELRAIGPAGIAMVAEAVTAT